MSGVQWAFAVWAAFIGSVGALMAIARTSPEDAFSNLSKWAERFGVHHIPNWLRDRRIDDVVFRWSRYAFVVLINTGLVGFFAWQWAGGTYTTIGDLLIQPVWHLAAFFLGPLAIYWTFRRKGQPIPRASMSLVRATEKNGARGNAELPPPQLPANATFSFKGLVFYVIRHNYSHDENIEFRLALRDVYDCIAHNATPITATYDGPVVRFTRNWISIIQSQGPDGAWATLDEIEKKATNANVQLLHVLEKRPYFRPDLQSLIGSPAGPIDLRGAIHKYQLALKSIPDKPNKELIVLALGESQKRLEVAAAAHLEWIGKLNSKISGARDELEALAKLE